MKTATGSQIGAKFLRYLGMPTAGHGASATKMADLGDADNHRFSEISNC